MEHVDELIAAHALHALDPDEEQRVEAHVAECAACRAKLRELEAVAGALAYAVSPAAAPPELRARVLSAIEPVARAPQREPEPQPAPLAAERRPRRRAGWWPRLAAVAVPALAAAVVGLAIWNVSLRSQLDSTRSNVATGAAVNLPGIGNAVASGSGTVTLYANARPAPAGKTYEAWVISDGKARPAGLFGGGTQRISLSQRVRPGDVIAVTVEPARGSSQPSSAPISSAHVTRI